MPTEASALPASLTVWAGPSRYVFAPGRDVVVGYGPGCDIPLERLAPQPPPAPRVDVVLRFTGAHWVAIDLSHRGIFLDGSRVPTVEIRDGLAITIEDPRHGPRPRRHRPLRLPFHRLPLPLRRRRGRGRRPSRPRARA